MRKTTLALIVTVLLLGVLFGTASAAPGISQLCSNADNFGLESHGQCVSVLQPLFNNGNADPVSVCKSLNNGEFKNQGQCVSAFRTASS